MKIEWLKEAGLDASMANNGSVIFGVSITDTGISVKATVFTDGEWNTRKEWESSVSWDDLEACEDNPLPSMIEKMQDKAQKYLEADHD
jgi:hypothetical protein